MVVATLTVGSFIDAKPKKDGDSTLWEDITDLMDLSDILLPILKRIGAVEKSIEDLEKEKLLQEAHAVSCDNSVTQWKAQKQIYVNSYTAAYNDHSAATQALSLARATLTVAQEDINTACDELDRLSYLSNKYSESSLSDRITEWQAKLRDARNRKSAAEADIPMQEAIIASAEQHMTDTQRMIIRAESMIRHFENREAYHDRQVDSLQQQIDALNAEKTAQQRKEEQIRNDYRNKDNDD